MKNLNSFCEVLKENNYKPTQQRILVFEAFFENKGKHLSVEEVYQFIRKRNPEIGLATVYRNIQLLVELEILLKLKLVDRITRYELVDRDENHRHHHLICNNCERIFEVEEDLMESIEKNFNEKYGFKVSDHHAKFFGLCADCQKGDD